MLVVGLTGSIAMGKSTTAAMFRERGVPVHDSDAAVHRAYRGAAAPPVDAAFPGVATEGVVDRAKLAARVLGDPAALARLESIVHPFVRASESAFLADAAARGLRIVLLDIPLLFETQAETRLDAIVVASAPAEVQRQRLLARPNLTEAALEAALARQMPDEQKRKRAHFVVETGRGMEAASRRVDAILRALAPAAL